MGYLYLIIAIIGEVVGTLSLKSSNGFTLITPSILVIVGYGVAFYFMILSMNCLLYTSPSPRDVEESRMPSSA